MILLIDDAIPEGCEDMIALDGEFPTYVLCTPEQVISLSELGKGKRKLEKWLKKAAPGDTYWEWEWSLICLSVKSVEEWTGVTFEEHFNNQDPF